MRLAIVCPVHNEPASASWKRRSSRRAPTTRAAPLPATPHAPPRPSQSWGARARASRVTRSLSTRLLLGARRQPRVGAAARARGGAAPRVLDASATCKRGSRRRRTCPSSASADVLQGVRRGAAGKRRRDVLVRARRTRSGALDRRSAPEASSPAASVRGSVTHRLARRLDRVQDGGAAGDSRRRRAADQRCSGRATSTERRSSRCGPGVCRRWRRPTAASRRRPTTWRSTRWSPTTCRHFARSASATCCSSEVVQARLEFLAFDREPGLDRFRPTTRAPTSCTAVARRAGSLSTNSASTTRRRACRTAPHSVAGARPRPRAVDGGRRWRSWSSTGGRSPRAREKIERVVKEETGAAAVSRRADEAKRRDGKAKRRGSRETEVIDKGKDAWLLLALLSRRAAAAAGRVGAVGAVVVVELGPGREKRRSGSSSSASGTWATSETSFVRTSITSSSSSTAFVPAATWTTSNSSSASPRTPRSPRAP